MTQYYILSAFGYIDFRINISIAVKIIINTNLAFKANTSS